MIIFDQLGLPCVPVNARVRYKEVTEPAHACPVKDEFDRTGRRSRTCERCNKTFIIDPYVRDEQKSKT